MTFKQKVHAHCISLLNGKVRELEKILHDLSDSAASDTKSSAGDKHETARAMVQIEQENTRKQLSEMLEQRTQLQKIDPNIRSPQIIMGSLVKTNRGYLFMSIALGKIIVEGEAVMVISPQSPLGIKLMRAHPNEAIQFSSTDYFIENIG